MTEKLLSEEELQRAIREIDDECLSESVPKATSALESQILRLFESGKVLTATIVHQKLKVGVRKYYNDKLWGMAQAGKIVHLENRGEYQRVPVVNVKPDAEIAKNVKAAQAEEKSSV